jgi:hypothetical protein
MGLNGVECSRIGNPCPQRAFVAFGDSGTLTILLYTATGDIKERRQQWEDTGHGPRSEV